MEVNLISPKSGLKSPPGVALLMTLSIITLLSITLMSAFEYRTVEIVHLENNLERFQAETLSRSAFRAILLGIQAQGLVVTVKNKDALNLFLQSVPLFRNGGIYLEEIKPIDHLFNLNTKFDSKLVRAIVFGNLVQNLLKEHTDRHEIFEEEIHSAISALIDFTDNNQEGDELFLYDFEQYPHEEPAYEVKNRPFDRISEVKLIVPFRNLKLSQEDIQKAFRIHGGKEYIDINLAEEEEVIRFLENYENVEGFEAVYDFREDLAKRIAEADSENSPTQIIAPTRFTPPTYRRGNSKWERALGTDLLSKLSPKEKDLFSIKTEHIRLLYRTTVGRVNLETEAIVAVEYLNPKISLDIKGFKILSYALH